MGNIRGDAQSRISAHAEKPSGTAVSDLLADNLKELRDERHYTQAQLGARSRDNIGDVAASAKSVSAFVTPMAWRRAISVLERTKRSYLAIAVIAFRWEPWKKLGLAPAKRSDSTAVFRHCIQETM
jgi:hypothetical protein